jgi:endonuclease/exonuclease/phosphatase family metal-dependent hydrolase
MRNEAPHRELTVATLNLLHDLTRWDERRALIVNGFKRTLPDVIALQEVVLPLNTAQWLADQLGGYHVHVTPKTGRERRKHPEGIAFLTRFKPLHTDWIALGAQHRVAQLIVIEAAKSTFTLVNSHLYWSVHDSPARLRQVHRLQDWLRAHAQNGGAAPLVICGDFNGQPGSRAILQMRAHYKSAHALKHGREPHWTCPTPVQFSTQRWRKIAMTLAGRATGKAKYKGGGYWRETVDYIFVNEHVDVRECHTVFDDHAPGDPTLYASDHLGLVATIKAKGGA